MPKALYIVHQCGDCAGSGQEVDYRPFYQALDNCCPTLRPCKTCRAKGYDSPIIKVIPTSRASIRQAVARIYAKDQDLGRCGCKGGRQYGKTCPDCLGTGVYMQDLLIYSEEPGVNPRFDPKDRPHYLVDELYSNPR